MLGASPKLHLPQGRVEAQDEQEGPSEKSDAEGFLPSVLGRSAGRWRGLLQGVVERELVRGVAAGQALLGGPVAVGLVPELAVGALLRHWRLPGGRSSVVGAQFGGRFAAAGVA